MSFSKTSECFFFPIKGVRTSIDDDEGPGRPVSTSKPEMIKRVRHIIREDSSRRVEEFCMLVGYVFSTTIMHQLMLSSRLDGILVSNNMTLVLHPLYSPNLAACKLFLLSKTENEAEEAIISNGGGKSSRISGCFQHDGRKLLPGIFPKVAAPLGSLPRLRMGSL